MVERIRVRCVESLGNCLTPGKEYEAIEEEEGVYKLRCDHGKYGEYLASRFIKVNETNSLSLEIVW